MLKFTKDQLYNCCTEGREPDWAKFDALELGGCVDAFKDEETEDTCFESGYSREEAEIFTVFAHLKEGGAEAITDIPKFFAGCLIMAELSRISGLPASVVC